VCGWGGGGGGGGGGGAPGGGDSSAGRRLLASSAAYRMRVCTEREFVVDNLLVTTSTRY
jgi:hypothetical protein